jgi:hypothetical protein
MWVKERKGEQHGPQPNIFILIFIRFYPNRLSLTLNALWKWLVWFIVFNATFNNISFLPWRSVLLVEDTGVPGENQ